LKDHTVVLDIYERHICICEFLPNGTKSSTLIDEHFETKSMRASNYLLWLYSCRLDHVINVQRQMFAKLE